LGFSWLGTCLRQLKGVAEKRVFFPLLLLGAGLVFAQPCRAATVGFENAGSLAIARQAHTATLLPNGKVLVAGGGDGSFSALASAQVYDIGLGFLRLFYEKAGLVN